MSYSVDFRKRILDEVSQGMTIADASFKYNISEQSIRNWLNDPDKYLNKTHNYRRRFDTKEKLEVLKQVEMKEGSIREIAKRNGISHNTLKTWIKDKNCILAVYLAHQQSQSVQWPVSCLVEGKEAMSLSKDSISTNAENRALKEENQYLKAKIAYLEKLMELNGTPAAKFKKKLDTELLEPSVKKENGQ